MGYYFLVILFENKISLRFILRTRVILRKILYKIVKGIDKKIFWKLVDETVVFIFFIENTTIRLCICNSK